MKKLSKKNQNDDSLLILPARQTYDFFGISRQGFKKWSDNPTFPKSAQTRPGFYDLKIVFDWWYAYNLGNKDIAQKMAVEMLKFREARREREELITAKLRGVTRDINEVNEALSIIMGTLKARMTSWRKGLPGKLKNRDEKAMSIIIRSETDLALEDAHRELVKICRQPPK